MSGTVHNVRKTVHMYRAEGIAEAGNPLGCAPGERRPLLVFLAGYRNDYDWSGAERAARAQHWVELDFGKAGQVTAAHIAEQDPVIRESYREALETGSSIVVYAGAAT